MIRLMDSCLKGSKEVDLIGKSGRLTGCMCALFCWQTEQPAMKLLINKERPDHQKSHPMIALV